MVKTTQFHPPNPQIPSSPNPASPSHFSTPPSPSKTLLLPHLSTTLFHSPNPNRQTHGKSHLRYRLQKSRCYHPKGNYNLPSPTSHFLPKSPSPNPTPQNPSPQPPNWPSPSNSLHISIVVAAKCPYRGCFQLPGSAPLSLYPGVLQTTPRSDAPTPSTQASFADNCKTPSPKAPPPAPNPLTKS